MKLHLDGVSSSQKSEDTLEVQLWKRMAEAGVLLAPGWIFSTDLISGSGPVEGEGHFRLSFSNTEVSAPILGNPLTNEISHESLMR